MGFSEAGEEYAKELTGMCSHYESVKDRHTLKTHFKIDDPPDEFKTDMWPTYMGLFVRKHERL